MFAAECTADTDVTDVALRTVAAIIAAVGPGMLRDDIPPSGSCGSIVVEASATSAAAASLVNAAVANGLVAVTMPDGTMLQAEDMSSKGIANECDVAAASTGPRARGDPRESKDGCELKASHAVAIVLGCLLATLVVATVAWYRHNVNQTTDTELDSVEMGDFDDKVEVGKMLANPLHASSTQETKFGGDAPGEGNVELSSFGVGAPKAAHTRRSVVSLKDVWGVSEHDGGKGLTPTPIIRRDSLFQIWGTDEDPPDIDTDAHEEGSIMRSRNEAGTDEYVEIEQEGGALADVWGLDDGGVGAVVAGPHSADW